jgi:adhesin/invasin
LGGVAGPCPGSVTVAAAGRNLVIAFQAAISFPMINDGITISQVRLNARSVAGTGTVTAILSGFSSAPTTNPITFTQPVVTVGTVLPSATASLAQVEAPFRTCLPTGLPGSPLHLAIVENLAATFTTTAQEAAFAGMPAPVSGTTVEVTFTGVPPGMTIQPANTTGSSSTLVVSGLPPAVTQETGLPIVFNFTFSSTDLASGETLAINFAIGHADKISPATLASAINVRVRLGPVRAVDQIPAFDDVALLSATPFVVTPCRFGALPSPQSFTVKAGANAPSLNLPLTVQEGGNHPFTMTASTTSGGDWLSVTPGSGTLPVAASGTMNVQSLVAGTYDGRITVEAPGVITMVITVNLTVQPNPPLIAISPSTLSFAGSQGGPNPPPQILNLSNSGGGALNWSVEVSTASGVAWLSVSPMSGSVTGTQVVPLTVSVNGTALAPGIHNASVRLTAQGAGNTPQTLAVTLALSAPATIVLTPAALSLITETGVSPASQTFQISNSGGGILGWTATPTTSTGGNWLSVAPNTGVAPSTLTITVNAASLARGTYSGQITIAATASTTASNSPQVLSVVVTVGGPVVNPGGVVSSASYQAGGIVAPGSIASVFGLRLSGTTRSASTLPLPTVLEGAQVLVNEQAAPLFFVSPTQVNFQMPVEARSSTVQIVVLFDTLRSASVTVPSGAELPSVFTVNQAGTGQAAALNADSTPNSAQNPAAADSAIALYVTGLGATNPSFATGQAGATSEPLNRTVLTPVVRIAGVASEVLYSGLAPGFVGLYQVNVRIPQGTSAGPSVGVEVEFLGRKSNPVTIAVR